MFVFYLPYICSVCPHRCKRCLFFITKRGVSKDSTFFILSIDPTVIFLLVNVLVYNVLLQKFKNLREIFFQKLPVPQSLQKLFNSQNLSDVSFTTGIQI